MKRLLFLLIVIFALFIIGCDDNNNDTDTKTDTEISISDLPNNSPELYTYNENGEGYEITSIKQKREEIEIPDTYNGKKVIGISEKAFFGDRILKKVILPEGIEYIGEKAFKDCDRLSEINLPSTVNDIGTDAFFDCNKLNYETYKGCHYLGNWLIELENEDLDVLEVRENTIGIAPFAFYSSAKLRTVNIPNSVKYIGTHAFFNCLFLRFITIGNGVEKIDEFAFGNCPLFKNVDMPSTVKVIGANAFYGCKGTITYMGDTVPVGFDLTWNGSCEIIYGREENFN